MMLFIFFYLLIGLFFSLSACLNMEHFLKDNKDLEEVFEENPVFVYFVVFLLFLLGWPLNLIKNIWGR